MIAVTTQHPHSTALHWGHTFFRWTNKHKHQVVDINVLWLRYAHALYSDAQTRLQLKHHVVMSNVMWFKYACVLVRQRVKWLTAALVVAWLASPSTDRGRVWLLGSTGCTNQMAECAKTPYMTLPSKCIMQYIFLLLLRNWKVLLIWAFMALCSLGQLS